MKRVTLGGIRRALLAVGTTGLFLSRLLSGELGDRARLFSGLVVLAAGALYVPSLLRTLRAGRTIPPRPRGTRLVVSPLWHRLVAPGLWCLLVSLVVTDGGPVLFLALACMAVGLYHVLSPGVHRERAVLAYQLAALLEMGVPLGQALRRLETEAGLRFSRRLGPMRTVLRYLAADVAEGAELSAAVQVQPFFPAVWGQWLRLGERCGQLPAMLYEISRWENSRTGGEWLRSLFGLLIVAPLTAMLFHTCFPVFVTVLREGDVSRLRPWAELDAWLIWFSDGAFWLVLLCLPLVWMVRRRGWWRNFAGKLRAPLLGPLLRAEEQLAALSSMQRGVQLERPLTEVVELGSSAVTHRTYRNALNAERIRAGSLLCELLEASPALFEASLVALIRTGEQSGELSSALDLACQILEEEVRFQEARYRHACSFSLQLTAGALVLIAVVAFWWPLVLFYDGLSQVDVTGL